MAKAKVDLSGIDAAVAVETSRQRSTWFDRLPAEAQELFLAAREKFQGGGYGDLPRLTLARVLIGHAEQQGWRVGDYKRMGEWLKKQN